MNDTVKNNLITNPWPIKVALIFFIACIVWFGRDLNFSAYAHPDERNKINQILDSDYNFNHPLLMLNSARIIALALEKTNEFEAVKLIGRSISVLYASLAVAVFTLAMGRLYGQWVAVACGFFLISNPDLLEFAHYFKEDPTLLLGISLTVLSMVIYSTHACLATTLLCGAAAALTFSGKYAGIFVMPFAAYVVVALSQNKLRDIIFFLLAFAVAFLTINFPAILALEQATGSLDREIVRLSGADQEVPRNVPHGNYTKMYSRTASPVMLGLLGVYVWELFRRRFQLSPVEWAITLMPITYFLILSFIPVISSRYFLPCGAMFACLSAVGVGVVAKYRFGKWIYASLIILSLVFLAPKLVKVNNGFQEDHVGELAYYLENKLPKNSLLLVAKWIGIPPIKAPAIKNHSFVPGDTMEKLRNEGYTHVLLEKVHYRNFIEKKLNKTNLSDQDFFKLKVFYESLFSRATLLRHWKQSDNKYLGKEMVLFSLQERDSSIKSNLSSDIPN